MNDTDDSSPLRRLQRWDAQRPGVPGEHWLAFALGIYLLVRRRHGPAARLASLAVGMFFVGRALSGRDGAIAVLQEQARRAANDGFVDVAAPWPYDERVRVSPGLRARASAPATHQSA